jgi:hypothetical protein
LDSINPGSHRLTTGNLSEWFGTLDDMQAPLYTSIVSSYGGGARGTESLFKVVKFDERHLYILNGLLTIVTTYGKTRSHQRLSHQLAKALPTAVAKRLMLIYGVLYPTASHLAAFTYGKTQAEAYLTNMFVYAGKPAESPQFTRFLQTTTEKHLGVGLGLRDWRQTLLTIMLNITKANFCLPLPEDTVHADIHRQFNHSARMGEGNYAIQVSEALTEISHTAVASNQRISLLWHETVGLSDPRAKPNPHVTTPHLPAVGPPPSIHNLVKPITAAVENVCTELAASTTTAILEKITASLQGFGSELFNRLGVVQSLTTMIPTPIPIQVHPRLLDRIANLLPRGITPRFKTPEQAEALQSNGLNVHVLVVMPTGSGKSMTFFGARRHHPTRCVDGGSVPEIERDNDSGWEVV